MRIIEQAPDRLLLHYSPWRVRALGALFAALGAGVLVLAASGALNGQRGVWVAFVLGGTFTLAGTATALSATDCRVIFDGPAMLVRMIRRGTLGATTTVYPFASIRDIALEVSPTGRGTNSAAFYRSVFVMSDGTRVPWTTASTGDLGDQARCVATARAFGGWDTSRSDTRTANASPASGSRRPTPLTAIPATSVPGDPPRLATLPRMQHTRIVGVALGCFALVGVVMMAVEAERLMVWHPVRAVVEASDVQVLPGTTGGTSYWPVVTYHYAVNGRQYTSSRVNAITIGSSYSWAQSMASRFVPGRATTAYVNPDHPASAYLVHEISLLPLCIALIPAVFGAVFLSATRWNDRQAALAAGVNVPILKSISAIAESRAA